MIREEKDDALKVFRQTSNQKKRLNRIGVLKIHWGHFLLSCNKYNEAEQSYRESLELFERTNNTYREHQCLNNIANTIFTKWTSGMSELSNDDVYNKCHKLWDKCLSYFEQSEYLFEYEIACENMAELMMSFRKSSKEEIKKNINTAMNLSTYLNDNTGINSCNNLLRNLDE